MSNVQRLAYLVVYCNTRVCGSTAARVGRVHTYLVLIYIHVQRGVNYYERRGNNYPTHNVQHTEQHQQQDELFLFLISFYILYISYNVGLGIVFLCCVLKKNSMKPS